MIPLDLNGIPGGMVASATIIFLALAIVLKITFTVLFKILSKVTTRTKTDLDDKILSSIINPVNIILVVSAGFYSIKLHYRDLDFYGTEIDTVYFSLVVLASALIVNRIGSVLMEWYLHSILPRSSSKVLDKGALPMVKNIGSLAIYTIALILILDQFGIEIGPFLAGLGIAGLAVALALQDSLGNFFSGLYILADKPVKQEEWILLEGGEEGRIDKIGWRSTRLRTRENNHVVIPNSKLAQSVITNYHAPNRVSTLLVELGVSYNDEPDKVTKALNVAVENAKKKTEILIKEEKPIIRLLSFDDFSIKYRIRTKINDYSNYILVKDLINREIFKEFKKKKITIPYPIRTIHMKKK